MGNKIGLKQLIQLGETLNKNGKLNESDYLEAGLPYSSSIVIPSPLTIEEWYRQGIGEIGLSIETFYQLTPNELSLAYEGYLRRMELQANLIQLAISRKDNPKPITLVEEKDTHTGSEAERQRTFEILGIQEDSI